MEKKETKTKKPVTSSKTPVVKKTSQAKTAAKDTKTKKSVTIKATTNPTKKVNTNKASKPVTPKTSTKAPSTVKKQAKINAPIVDANIVSQVEVLPELKVDVVVSETKAPSETKKEPKVKKVKEKKEKEVVKTPQPKPKNFNKEEKKLLVKLEEAFRYVVNLTNVIESQKMDTSIIPDLTLGEVHVLETVALNNNKPMSFIANKQKITVGALTTMINRLVQKGYLVRTRDEMDNRIIRLSITPQTKKVLKAHDKFHDDIIGLALDGVTIRDATKVMVMFAEVLENYHNPQAITKKAESKKAPSKSAPKKKPTTKAKKTPK